MAVEELEPRSDGRVLKLAELLRDAASEEPTVSTLGPRPIGRCSGRTFERPPGTD